MSSSSFSAFSARTMSYYPVRLFFCDVDVQLSRQLFAGCPGGLFGFPFSAIFASRSLFIPFTWSLHTVGSWFKPILWHLESRRCCEFYLTAYMHLKILNLYEDHPLISHLLIGCSVFYSFYPFCPIFFAIFANWLSFILFTRSSLVFSSRVFISALRVLRYLGHYNPHRWCDDIDADCLINDTMRVAVADLCRDNDIASRSL